jgi:probable DNA metabolism protein
MAYRREIIYNYDGTFGGFLCCVFESFTRGEIPAAIVNSKEAQGCLYEQFVIETDPQKAERTAKSIEKKIGRDALTFLNECLFTCLDNKETFMLDFIRLGHKEGRKIMNLAANDTVKILLKAVRGLKREAASYIGFIRFSVCGGLLIARIKPKNYVLPFLSNHFAERFSQEKFIIYDENHRALCAGAGGKFRISEVSQINIPKAREEELFYAALWKKFYGICAVESRTNKKLRDAHMPKRYRDTMSEFL